MAPVVKVRATGLHKMRQKLELAGKSAGDETHRSKAKSLRLKSNLEKDFAAAVYLSEAPSPPKLLSRGRQAIL